MFFYGTLSRYPACQHQQQSHLTLIALYLYFNLFGTYLFIFLQLIEKNCTVIDIFKWLQKICNSAMSIVYGRYQRYTRLHYYYLLLNMYCEWGQFDVKQSLSKYKFKHSITDPKINNQLSQKLNQIAMRTFYKETTYIPKCTG